MPLDLDFPKLDKEKWNELIAKALKINSLSEFEHKTLDGLTIPAFNHPSEHIEANNPLIAHNTNWKIAISVDANSQNAHSSIMNALQNGVEAIVLSGQNLQWDQLFTGVFHEMIYTDVSQVSKIELINQFIDYSISQNKVLDNLSGSFILSEEALKANVSAVKKLPGFHFFTGDSSSENIPEALFEISSKLKSALELCDEIDLPISSIRASLSVGTHLPSNVAKLRALRIIWANLLKAYGKKFQALFIKTTTRVKDGSNKENALIENTSACINAALGTTDMICSFHSDDINHTRLNQNIQHIMKMESNMQSVVDPLAGSYAIEKMTNHLAKACWEKLSKN